MSLNNQKPYSTSSVKNTKPNVEKTESVLTGYNASSFNGGHNHTICYQQVMAGQKIKEKRWKGKFHLLTPLTPAYQNLRITFRSYLVPNSRVWTNAEKYTAQKGGASEVKIAEIPNLGGKMIPLVSPSGTITTPLSNTTLWRDSWIKSYLPRMGLPYSADSEMGDWLRELPKVSVLPLRGRIAIYNDMERNKELMEQLMEFKGDTVTDMEWQSYLPKITDIDISNMRARRNNSYYTDYYKEPQGFDSARPTDEFAELVTWANWEGLINEARAEAENSQMNDWNIIAKIRGSKLLSEGKVQKIGEYSTTLNYASITQSTYNTNDSIKPEFKVMGKQGAYSYTEIDVPLFAGIEFNEEGYVHTIATVSADTVFSTGFDRLELNVTPFSQYRPDLEGQKFDVLYNYELGTQAGDNEDYTPDMITGYKRKFSEYFKLNNTVSGDMTTPNYMEVTSDGVLDTLVNPIETQKTYSFFEESDRVHRDYSSPLQSSPIFFKKEGYDYTDILINKNQAILNEIEAHESQNEIRIKGQNQIFYLGIAYCITDLPISADIKDNYTKWGEH